MFTYHILVKLTECCIWAWMYDCTTACSYLKTLLEPFNEKASKFIENLHPVADGKTEVPMKTHFADFTLETISKVSSITECTPSCGHGPSQKGVFLVLALCMRQALAVLKLPTMGNIPP